MNRYERWLAEHPEKAAKPDVEPGKHGNYGIKMQPMGSAFDGVEYDVDPPPERRHTTGSAYQGIGVGVAAAGVSARSYAEQLAARQRARSAPPNRVSDTGFTTLIEQYRRESLRRMERSLSNQMYYPAPSDEDEDE